MKRYDNFRKGDRQGMVLTTIEGLSEAAGKEGDQRFLMNVRGAFQSTLASAGPVGLN